MNDANYERLMRMFPGNLPDVDEEAVDWPAPSRLRRPSAPAAVVRQVHQATRQQFEKVMAALPPAPVAPSAPARLYLIEHPANVTRWLDEAREIESDVKLGQAAEPHQVTRLLLEAIPVVEKFGTP